MLGRHFHGDRGVFHRRYGAPIEIHEQFFASLHPMPSPVDYLRTMWWLYWAPSEQRLADLGFLSRHAFHDSVERTLSIIDENPVLSWDDRLLAEVPGEVFGDSKVCVDTTFMPIQRPHSEPEQRFCYDGRHRRHGLKYFLAVTVDKGLPVWWEGPFFPTINDNNIMDLSGMEERLLPHELVLADGGFRGTAHRRTVLPFRHRDLDDDQRVYNHIQRSVRVIVENVFRLVKQFEFCRTAFPRPTVGLRLDLHRRATGAIIKLIRTWVSLEPVIRHEPNGFLAL
ncbi:hypothetical protein PAPYR_267 [Paratrimastix pyriformis]|uniref:DDE Tnp4 domain-containing protein n=1 Tax=Paratrimastix pyriformis TaxID=342808 RepID=A0ABQ8V069_9EUKA|nr:hypothetical protein PAPYR_8408 [Paratrimastix pyriformis]KAJ4463024.1 hypothetical protein PAPYR_267 [Paratrimastix pyriformis]